MTRPDVTVRRVAGWWTWYCNHPTCLDNLGGFRTPGDAADDGRKHHYLWHDPHPNFNTAAA